jgi:hypothetical protein
MAGDILDIGFVSQSFLRNPFPTLTRLREAGPVVWVKLPFLCKTGGPAPTLRKPTVAYFY